MAGASEKKRIVRAKQVRESHYRAFWIINLIYVLLRILWFWGSFGIGTFFAFLLISGISIFALSMIMRIVEEGSNYSLYQDLLFVNWGVQLATILTDWGYLLYLSIPGYVLYQYGPFLWGMLKGGMGGMGGIGGGDGAGGGGSAGTEELSAQELKRQRRAERRRTKVIRR